MAKAKASKEIQDAINKASEVEIQKVAPTLEDVRSYIQAKEAGQDIGSGSFNDYLQQKDYADSSKIVIADLSGMQFDTMNLKGADFSGSKFGSVTVIDPITKEESVKTTQFIDCNLEEAIFCDSDLKDSLFKNSVLKNADFRGADLGHCKFDKGYADWIELRIVKPENADKVSGIKFSTTHDLANDYIKQNDKIKENAEKKYDQGIIKRIVDKELEVKGEYAKLSYLQAGYLRAGYKETGNKKYDKVAKELAELKEVKEKRIGAPTEADLNYVVDPSLINIISFQKGFDPAYVRGERDIERQYVKLSRRDVEAYLAKIKTEPSLSLNDVAKEKLVAGVYQQNHKIVADCGGLDLKKLDFTGANLEGSNFAGANLNDCKFNSANISKASFESARMKACEFKDTTARDVNFFNTNLAGSEIKNCDFTRTHMSNSNNRGTKVDNTKLDNATIKHGEWERVKLTEVTVNLANLESINLDNASLRKIEAKHTILNDATLNNATIIEGNFNQALMQNVRAKNVIMAHTNLQNVVAINIDLTEAKLDEQCNFNKANLENAVLNGIQAEKASFIEANLDGAEAKDANLSGAHLEKASAREADFEGANLNQAKLKSIDMTCAQLLDVKAKEADFSEAKMVKVDLEGADLEKATMVKADLKGADLKGANLKQVNAEGADLRHVKTDDKTNCKDLKVDNAIVNIATEALNGAKGQVIQEDVNLKRKPIDVQVHNNEAKELKHAEKKLVLGGQGQLEAIKEAISPHQEVAKGKSSNKGKIAGAAIGVASGLAIGGIVIGIVVATGGIALPAAAALLSVGAGVGLIGGTGVGHYFGDVEDTVHRRAGRAVGQGVITSNLYRKVRQIFGPKIADSELFTKFNKAAGVLGQAVGTVVGDITEVIRHNVQDDIVVDAGFAVEDNFNKKDADHIKQMGRGARDLTKGTVGLVKDGVLKAGEKVLIAANNQLDAAIVSPEMVVKVDEKRKIEQDFQNKTIEQPIKSKEKDAEDFKRANEIVWNKQEKNLEGKKEEKVNFAQKVVRKIDKKIEKVKKSLPKSLSPKQVKDRQEEEKTKPRNKE